MAYGHLSASRESLSNPAVQIRSAETHQQPTLFHHRKTEVN